MGSLVGAVISVEDGLGTVDIFSPGSTIFSSNCASSPWALLELGKELLSLVNFSGSLESDG